MIRCPTERLLQLSDQEFRSAVAERLLVPRVPEGRCPRVFSTGATCGHLVRGGSHAHCCRGGAGIRTTGRHDPLVREWARILRSAGRLVLVETRDPLMGPSARLDIVEFAGPSGAPSSYDVSVVTALREDPAFVRVCAQTPGHAAELRHLEKLRSQYPHRVAGSRLVPLVVETGGRWHRSVPSLARALGRDVVGRLEGFEDRDQGAVVAWWAARLSALLLRGNALAHRVLAPPAGGPVEAGDAGHGPLPHAIPEGDCAYELLVR